MGNISKVNSRTKISDINRYRFHYSNEDTNFISNETLFNSIDTSFKILSEFDVSHMNNI